MGRMECSTTKAGPDLWAIFTIFTIFTDWLIVMETGKRWDHRQDDVGFVHI